MSDISAVSENGVIAMRFLGLTDYKTTWQSMREFTNTRDQQSEDELWVCEHSPVYTLGQAGRTEHILNTSGISVVKSDRGGQVTYHGPGQVVVYCLINLRRARLGVRDMVTRLENSAIELLDEQGIVAESRRDAPGVYVSGAKIAALGLRVRKGCSYHGIALNINPDLTPFLGIDPCGFQDLEVTSLQKLGVSVDKDQLVARFVQLIERQLTRLGNVTTG